MLKAVMYLVTRSNDAKMCNHSVVIGMSGKMRKFRYFGHTICIVNEVKKVFTLDDCGYSKSRSTKRALNDYKKFFEEKGYKLV